MIDHEKIRKQAKQIMDEFVNSLPSELKDDFGTERDLETRVPGKHLKDGFKERMLKNAPKKNSDFIIAGKKNW